MYSYNNIIDKLCPSPQNLLECAASQCAVQPPEQRPSEIARSHDDDRVAGKEDKF